jgi:hypothetical protein
MVSNVLIDLLALAGVTGLFYGLLAFAGLAGAVGCAC